MTHVITNTGVENELGDGGERESRFYYAQGGLAEERNGSGQLVRAYTWGTQGSDLVWVEINGDPAIDNDSDPDNTTGGESSETPADARYFAHADRTGGIAALTEYDTGGTNNGRIRERHASAGTRRVLLIGDSGSGELVAQSFVSLVGWGGGGPSPLCQAGTPMCGGGGFQEAPTTGTAPQPKPKSNPDKCDKIRSDCHKTVSEETNRCFSDEGPVVDCYLEDDEPSKNCCLIKTSLYCAKLQEVMSKECEKKYATCLGAPWPNPPARPPLPEPCTTSDSTRCAGGLTGCFSRATRSFNSCVDRLATSCLSEPNFPDCYDRGLNACIRTRANDLTNCNDQYKNCVNPPPVDR